MVRTGPVIGLLGHIAVLAVLTATVGLGGAGWITGLAYGLATAGLLIRALYRAGASRLGPAGRVTLSRSALVGGVAALTIEYLNRPAPVAVLVGVATAALVLDAVDGYVARRTGTPTALGARFDMEVDSFLLLALSSYVAQRFGGWVLMIGLMRYAFVAANWTVPWMRCPLPLRYWRKVVAAIQGIALVVAVAGVLPRTATVGLVLCAIGLLVESFGRDIWWLWSTAHPVATRVASREKAAV